MFPQSPGQREFWRFSHQQLNPPELVTQALQPQGGQEIQLSICLRTVTIKHRFIYRTRSFNLAQRSGKRSSVSEYSEYSSPDMDTAFLTQSARAGVTKFHGSGDLNKRKFTSQYFEGCKSNIKVSVGLVSLEASPLSSVFLWSFLCVYDTQCLFLFLQGHQSYWIMAPP